MTILVLVLVAIALVLAGAATPFVGFLVQGDEINDDPWIITALVLVASGIILFAGTVGCALIMAATS